MGDPNRLELVISIKDDGSAGAQSIKARYKSIVDDAQALGISLDRQLQQLSASSQRSIDAYLRRTEMAGKDALGKIDVRRDQLIALANGDEALIKQINIGTQGLKDAYKKRQDEISRARDATTRAAESKSQGIAAGKATLSGEAEFQAAFTKLKERDQLVRDLEARAAVAGKKPSERLAMEMKSTLAAFSNAPADAKKVEDYYKTIISAAQKAEAEAGGHGVGGQALRRGLLAVKDLLSGSTRGAVIEGTDILVGTSGSGGVLQKFIPQLGEIAGVSTMAAYGVAGLTAAFVGLGVAGLVSVHKLAETGQQIKEFSERTGIKPENVQHFQFAAKAEGVDPEVFQHAFRSLAQATDEDSTSGAKIRKELKALNVDLYDQSTGKLRPTENIMLDLAAAIQKLPPGLKESAASLEIFKRSGDGLLPVILHLNENFKESQKLGGTFSKADTEMLDEWHKQIAIMGLEWDRFVAKLMLPLAVNTTVVLKFVTDFASSRNLGGVGGHEHQTALDFNPITRALEAMGVFDAPEQAAAKPAGAFESRQKHAEQIAFQRHKAEVNALDADLMKDPHERLRRAQQELSRTEKPDAAKMQGPEVVKNYRAALEKVKAAQAEVSGGGNRDTDRGLQDIISARQEGLTLDARIAKQRVTDQGEILRAGMGSKSGLASEQDIQEELKLAQIAAHAETVSEINRRQFRIDPKTGRKIDEANEPGFREFKRIQEQELEPKRVQEEYDKILTKMLVDSTKFYQTRTDESMKHYQEEWERRHAGELELQDQIAKIGNEISDRRTTLDIEANDRAKTIAIESLGSVNAQTLKDKMSLEDQKLAIEKEYADRGLVLQLSRLNTERARAVAGIEQKYEAMGIPKTDDRVKEAVSLENDRFDQDADALRQANSDRELLDAKHTAKAKEDLQIQSNRKIYDSLKQDAAGLFDQLVSHTKSWADFAKDLFKSAILTPVKDIFSSQVAALFTGLITGNKVTFDPLGTGQGRLGKLGDALGRAGGGQPNFHVPRETPFVSSKVDQPGHIGEAVLEGGALRVVIANTAQVGQAHAVANAGVGASLANSFATSILSGSRNFQTLAPRETVASQLITNPALFGNAYSDTAGYGTSPNGFATMGEIAGLGTPDGIFSAGPAGIDWAMPTAPPYIDPNLAGPGASTSGGFFSRIGSLFGLGNPSDVHGTPPFLPSEGGSGSGSAGFGGLFSSIGTLFGRGGGSSPTGEIDAETGLPLGHGIPGSPDNSSGETSAGVGGTAGAMLMAAGAGLVMDGLRRKPGVGSAIETPLGAGMIGFKFAGMKGGLIGAGIGLGADGVRRGGWTGFGEDIGGGALIGGTLGGPAGALLGGAVGAGVGLVRMMFETDRQHTKKLVKQIYGMDINNATADSIIQIAKQSFGKQIEVAIRSPQVRELLKLYSQATGQKKAEDMFAQDVVHSASFSEVNGRLTQNAVYDNGNAYAYSSQFATNGGVQTSPLSTYQPNQGVFAGTLQLNLNGQAASDVLRGQVTSVANPQYVQSQSLNASRASYGRTAQQNMALSPSALAQ